MPDLTKYAEVREVGQRYANQLLATGLYQLLQIGMRNFEWFRHHNSAGLNPTYIRNDVVYVIGRLKGQPDFPDFQRPDYRDREAAIPGADAPPAESADA